MFTICAVVHFLHTELLSASWMSLIITRRGGTGGDFGLSAKYARAEVLRVFQPSAMDDRCRTWSWRTDCVAQSIVGCRRERSLSFGRSDSPGAGVQSDTDTYL